MHSKFVKLNERTQANVTLVWLPHAGGSCTYFEELSARLPQTIHSVGFDYPGRARRRREPLGSDLMAIVADVAAALSTLAKPYVVFGHSMGALVGYEACRLLEVAGARRPKLLILSSCNPPHLKSDSPMLHRVHDDALLERVAAMGGLADLADSGEELLRLSLPILRSDITAIEMHRFLPWPRTRQDLAIYGGHEDVMVDAERMKQWRNITGGRTSLREFAGGHFYMNEHADPFVTALVADVVEATGAA